MLITDNVEANAQSISLAAVLHKLNIAYQLTRGSKRLGLQDVCLAGAEATFLPLMSSSEKEYCALTGILAWLRYN